MIIYFDNAATSLPKPKSVIKAVTDAMTEFGSAKRGAYLPAMKASRAVYDTRIKVGELFNCCTDNVAFTCNATESLNATINGLFSLDDHVITTVCDHNSVLRPLYRLHSQGMGLTIIEADEYGNINYDAINKSIKKNTKAIVCTHASNITGNITNIDKIGNICRENKLLFVLDTAQTAGSIPVDMKKQNIDVLCFTGHKGLLGPQGIGGICINDNVQIKPFKVGGSGVNSFDIYQPINMPERLEAGTLNTHGIAGLLKGIEYITEHGIENIHAKEYALCKQFYNGIKDIPLLTIYGDFTGDRCPIVSLNVGKEDSAIISDLLYSKYQICTRSGAHCAPLMHKHFDTVNQGMVRFSFSYFNTEEEIETGIKAIKEISNLFD